MAGSMGEPAMYAIAFDLDTAQLQELYHATSWQNAYADIGRELNRFGFTRQQGSVYFGGDKVTPVTCVMAVQAIAVKYSWFQPSVTDIRMLRIEELNDLAPAISQAVEMRKGNFV